MMVGGRTYEVSAGSVGDNLTSALLSLPRSLTITVRVLWDAMAWIFAVALFTIIRYDFNLTNAQWDWVLIYSAIAVVLQVGLGFLTQVYLGRSRLGSFAEITWMTLLVGIVGIPLGFIMATTIHQFPRGVGLVVPPLALMTMAAGRWVFRVLLSVRQRSISEDSVPVVVYGAGDLGHQVAHLVDIAPSPPYQIVGYVDDDPAKKFLRVRGYRLLGTGENVVDIARARGATAVILAISNAPATMYQRVSEECAQAGLDLIVVPTVQEMIGGQVTLASLREFNVADLLGRRPIETDLSSIADYVNGKCVLITGAGGSIGSELARQVHQLGPSKLVLLDRDESELHSVQLSLYGNGLLDSDDMVLCDIRDRQALQLVFDHHQPEVVFHAAALKHLPLLERYPDEGWKTNVLGTLNVLQCAHSAGVQRFVNISTDKAADASSVLGRTKRIAERLTAWYAEQQDFPYLSVRFGNVLGSRGSVLHAFRVQIEQGGPVTVTHPDVTRFFMTIPEACELVLQAGAMGRPGEVLVLDMGQPVKIIDVAKRLIAESGEDIEIRFTGLRPGEKLHEVLFSGTEDGASSEHHLITQVSVPPMPPHDLPDESPFERHALQLAGPQPARVPGSSALA